MNNINFTGRNNFPLAIETMTFLQAMADMGGTLALLGGDTYILSGCETYGLTVSSGYVVIDGEILPFTGGALQEYVYIKEAKRTVISQMYIFADVYNTRTVEFGYGDTRYKWENFKRVSTNTELADAIAQINKTLDGLQGIPKGIITMWSGSVNDIPQGWALCTGQEPWIPNLSGRFIVGYNEADEDYNEIGKRGGLKEIQLTEDQMPKHQHYVGTHQEGETKKGDGARDASVGNWNDDNVWGTKKTNEAGGNMPHENRPPYYVLAYIIKL